MRIYVAEIAGRPIVNASSLTKAAEIIEDPRVNGLDIMLDQFGPRNSEDEMLGVVF
jgi:hypothetical protein